MVMVGMVVVGVVVGGVVYGGWQRVTALNPSDDTAAAADTAADGAHGLFAGACNAKMKMLVLVLGAGVAATTATTGDDRQRRWRCFARLTSRSRCVSLVITCPPLPFPAC